MIRLERSLNDDFARRTVTLASLEEATQHCAAAHLKYHLSTVEIFSPEQVARYNELRGYQSDANPLQHHHQ